MPTLLTTIFADKRPCKPAAAATGGLRQTFEAKPFIPTAPHVAHSIKDTLDYVDLVRGKSSTATIADYATRFVVSSAEMRKLDEALPPIMMTPNKPQNFTHVVVDLARMIPKDADGTHTSRKNLLVEGLSRSLTLRASLKQYDAEQGLDTTGKTASAAWALRRAFRSFGEDAAGIAAFASELSAALPDSKWEIAHIYRDFQLNPKLRTVDAGSPVPHRG
jgi:hypothetical protein